MSGEVGGSAGVPAGERLLWRGSPDPDRTVRRWWGNTLRGIGAQVAGVTVLVMTSDAAAHFGFQQLWVIGLAAAFLVVPRVLRAGSPRRMAVTTFYQVTDQRLLVELAGRPRDLRLVNLPDLRLELHGDGFGSIFFTPPIGGSPRRYLQRLARWIPQLEDSSELLVCIPEAARVLGLLTKAQSDALAVAPDLASHQSAGPPATTPAVPAEAIPTQPAIGTQSIMRSAAVMPTWFGAVFLVVGVGVLALGLSGALSGGPGGWAPALVGLPFALVGGVVLRARLAVFRAGDRLRAQGAHVGGVVVDVAGTGTMVNHVEQWTVRYTFEVSGVQLRGQSGAVPWESVARFAPGDPVDVIYDPADPELNTIPEVSAS